MDRGRFCDLSDEILKNKFYDCMMHSFLPDNISQSPGALLNGYFAEIVTINTTSPKYLRSPPVYHNHRKSLRHSKDYALHHFQDQFLEDIPEEQPEVTSVLGSCPDHPKEKLRYFCETCDEPICLDCTSSEHRKHRFSYLRDVYHKQKHSMASLLGKGKTQMENTRKSLNEVKNLLSKLQEERASVEKSIRENTQILMAALQQQEDILLDELNAAFKSKESSLRKERQHYELILERLSGSCQYTERAIKFGNELEILVIQKHLKRRLHEISNTRKDYNSTTNLKNVYYFPDPNSTENARKALGHIVVSDTCSDLSTANGDGLVKAQVGSAAEFVVTAKGFDDQPKTQGGDLVTIDVRSPSKAILPSEIVDKGDGSYTVAFTPSLNGEHEVGVSIHHQPIRGSPFKVMVTNPRIYSKITRPILCIGSLGEVRGKFKLPCGVAVDSEGKILVADCHNHRIQIFSPQGRFVKSFGNLGEKNGQLNNPTDVAVDKQGNIIVCDKDNHRIQRFTKDGVFINKFGVYGENQGKLKRPWGISLGNDDEIIVTDRKNSRIQIFKEDGSLLRVFGCHGHARGELDQPYHAIMDSKENIFVTDSNNHAVKVFDSNGNFVREIGTGESGQSMLKYPTGIAFDMDDHVIVSDQYNHRIQIFNEDGSLEATLASGLNGMGQKCYPKGVAVSPGGYIVVADSDNHRVIVL